MSTVVKDLGAVSAYAYAVEKGYTGTEAEFAELMADYAEVGQRAEDAADSALESKTAAQTAATTATNKASEATTAAQTASTKASEAVGCVETATQKATEATQSASQASGYAQTAETAKTDAQTAKTQAETARDNAVTAKTAAETAQGKAEDAQEAAEDAAESVSASAAQITTNAEDITQLKEDLTTKADLDELYKAFPTDAASGSVASFADGANVPVKSLVVNIDPVQSGSGDPSPTNVRPISGWDGTRVVVSGINVWDGETVADGYFNGVGTWSSVSIVSSKNPIPVRPKERYYFNNGNGSPMYITYWSEAVESGQSAEGCIGRSNDVRNLAIDIPDGCYYIHFNLGGAYGSEYKGDIVINYPSADHEYHDPVAPSVTDIEFGQTVYGGVVDVINGTVTKSLGYVDLGTLLWRSNGTNSVYTADVLKSVGGDNCICSALIKVTQGMDTSLMPNASFKTYADNNYIAVKMDGITSVNAKTMLSGMQLVYPLAEPNIVNIDPHEITALLGSNNLWADSGDSDVTYRADPTLYIQRLTEPDADMVADANITSGNYFMVGNTLYKATANIASGATISPNVNCTRKSLSEALNELNA